MTEIPPPGAPPPQRPRKPAPPALAEPSADEPEHLRTWPPPEDTSPARKNLVVVPPSGEPAKPTRPLRSRSYLSILTILSTPAMRQRVLGDRQIEFDDLRGVITVGRQPISDEHGSFIRSEVERTFQGDKDGNGMRFSLEDIERALHQVAMDHRYHPVQEYLNELEWDGEDRLPWLARDVLGIGTAVTKLDLTLLRKWLVSAVARAMEPGCKVDTVLVLVGPQGYKKSTFFRVLAGEDWFCDSSFDPSTKDGADAMSGAWIYEWPELEAMQRARSQNSVKAFITTQIDIFRPAYARHKVRRPRTCVIVGTSNDDDFLSDRTGNRRYHPIRVGAPILVEDLRRARDQIWAQARALWAEGETVYLTPDEEELLRAKQAEFEATSAWDDVVRTWAAGQVQDTLSISDVLIRALELRPGSWTKGDEQRAAQALRRAGWEEFRPRNDDGSRPRAWRRVTRSTTTS